MKTFLVLRDPDKYKVSPMVGVQGTEWSVTDNGDLIFWSGLVKLRAFAAGSWLEIREK